MNFRHNENKINPISVDQVVIELDEFVQKYDELNGEQIVRGTLSGYVIHPGIHGVVELKVSGEQTKLSFYAHTNRFLGHHFPIKESLDRNGGKPIQLTVNPIKGTYSKLVLPSTKEGYIFLR